MAEKLTDLGLMPPSGWTGRATTYTRASTERILQSRDTEEADLQIKMETLAVMHSIRRILILVLVVVPLIIAAAVIVLTVVSKTGTVASCLPYQQATGAC